MKYLREYNKHDSYETELNGGGVDISLPNVSYCEDVKDIHYTPYNLVRFYVGEITGTTPQTVYIDIVPLGSVDNSTEEVQVSEENKWYTYVLPKDKGLLRIISSDSVKKIVVKANIGYYDIDGDGMFLTSIVETSFKGSDTSKVTDMSSMFNDCNGLTSLDLSNFNTSNVTNMRNMFNDCTNLTSLDVSNFNTSKVTDISLMFRNCTNLTSLDVSNFNTSKVTDMSSMFDSCSNLTSLTLSGWDMSKVTDTTDMFNGCGKLSTITMKGCSQDTINKITAVKPSGATIIS